MSSLTYPGTTLICTLGGKPQVVTMTLDLLLAQGEEVDEVRVLYLESNPRYAQAYQRLSGEFAGDRYGGRACRLRPIPIRLGGTHPLEDVRSQQEVDAVLKAAKAALAEVKASNRLVHLSLSAGRRMLALAAVSAAVLHFTPSDQAWHLYTPSKVAEEMEAKGLLHAPPGAKVRLLRLPLTPWASYFPGTRALLDGSPQEAQRRLDEENRARCGQVWQALSPAQRKALSALCQTPSRADASKLLGVEVSTLDDHKTEIFRACRLAWEDEKKPNLDFLRRYFKPFLAEQGGDA